MYWLFYQKLGKKSPHCGLLTIHNTDVSYDLDEVDIAGELRAPRVILVLVCEIREGLHDANMHTAEVVIAQLTTRRLQGFVAISLAKDNQQ